MAILASQVETRVSLPPVEKQQLKRLKAIGLRVRRSEIEGEYKAVCVFGRGHGSRPVRLVILGRQNGGGSVWIHGLPGAGDQHILDFDSFDNLKARTKDLATLQRIIEDLRSAYGC